MRGSNFDSNSFLNGTLTVGTTPATTFTTTATPGPCPTLARRSPTRRRSAESRERRRDDHVQRLRRPGLHDVTDLHGHRHGDAATAATRSPGSRPPSRGRTTGPRATAATPAQHAGASQACGGRTSRRTVNGPRRTTRGRGPSRSRSTAAATARRSGRSTCRARPAGTSSRSRPEARSRSTSRGCRRTTTSPSSATSAQAFNHAHVAARCRRCRPRPATTRSARRSSRPSVFSARPSSRRRCSRRRSSARRCSQPVGVQPVGLLAVGLQPVGVLARRCSRPSVFSPSVFSPSVFSPDPTAYDGRPDPEPDRDLGQRRHGERARLRQHLEQHRQLLHPGQRPQRDLRPGRARSTSPCTRTPAPAPASSPSTADAPLRTPVPASNLQTLILADYGRMTDDGQLDGDEAEAHDLRRRRSAARSSTSSQVSPRVAALNAQADANTGCPYAKNLVANAIRDIVTAVPRREPEPEVHRHRRRRPRDPVLPLPGHRRASAPSRTTSPPVLDTSRLAGEPAVERRALAGRLRLDQRPAAEGRRPAGPRPPVGRLVKTPTEIIGLLDAYLGLTNGVVATPTSSLVTGYDFMANEANVGRGRPQRRPRRAARRTTR